MAEIHSAPHYGEISSSHEATVRLCRDGGSDDIAGSALLGGGLHGVDGHTEVAREHRGDLGDRANLEVVLLDVTSLDGALAVLAENSLALFIRDVLKKRADIRIVAAADLAEAGDPVRKKKSETKLHMK